MNKQKVYNILRYFQVFNLLRQFKISFFSNFKRDIKIDFVDFSHFSYSQAGIEQAKQFKDQILMNLPKSYDNNIIEAYNILKTIDFKIIEELDSIANYLKIDNYLLLAKEFLFIPETCTSIAFNTGNGIYVGQNLDLGYDGSNLLIKKYKDYITVGFKSHPLWSTVGMNKYGISYSGSSVNSVNIGRGVIPSVINSKIILSNTSCISEVIDFFNKYKFYVGNDAGSYIVSDTKNIYYMECDSKNFIYEKMDRFAFSTNKFIKQKENNLIINDNIFEDASKREIYFNSINKLEFDSFIQMQKLLSEHNSNVCAHSSKTVRYTTCTTIIDKKNRTFYFTKKLPCKARNESDFFKIKLDFN